MHSQKSDTEGHSELNLKMSNNLELVSSETPCLNGKILRGYPLALDNGDCLSGYSLGNGLLFPKNGCYAEKVP